MLFSKITLDLLCHHIPLKTKLGANGFSGLKEMLMAPLRDTKQGLSPRASINNLGLIMLRHTVLSSNLPRYVQFSPLLSLLAGQFVKLIYKMHSFMAIYLRRSLCHNLRVIITLNTPIMFVN